ncbi:NAD(P)H nitroreductase [Candidatus Epulonipiscioides gigas]|nr:NAD(P)H nitroreductase [Epulopiscium sp. SCG-C07WGA-EpuloA2]
MNIISIAKSRYSAKEFDPNKKFTKEQLEDIETLLQYSPSSTNIQPWHFVIADTDDGKAKIAEAACGFYSFNEPKVRNASAVVVFASKVELTEDYLNHISDVEHKDGRFPQPEFKEQNHAARSIFAKMHKYDYKDFQQWADKQVYLNLGNFLLATAALGIDSLAMEGFDLKKLDEILGLREKGFTAAFVVALGYHSAKDFNKDLPKSRLPKSEIIDRI